MASYSLLLCREVAYRMMRQCLCLCLRNGKNQPAERGIESSANGRNLIRYLAVVLFFVGGVGYRNTGKVPEGGAHCSSGFSLVLSFFLFFLSFFLVAWGFHVWCCAIGRWNRVKHSFSLRKKDRNTVSTYHRIGFLSGEGGGDLGVEYQYVYNGEKQIRH